MEESRVSLLSGILYAASLTVRVYVCLSTTPNSVCASATSDPLESEYAVAVTDPSAFDANTGRPRRYDGTSLSCGYSTVVSVRAAPSRPTFFTMRRSGLPAASASRV